MCTPIGLEQDFLSLSHGLSRVDKVLPTTTTIHLSSYCLIVSWQRHIMPRHVRSQHLMTSSCLMHSQCCILSHADSFVCFSFWLTRLADPALGTSVLTYWVQSQTSGSPRSCPPGQVLMLVYSDTVEGLIKTSRFPPCSQYVHHFIIDWCFTFVLPFIQPMRNSENADTSLSHHCSYCSCPMKNKFPFWVITFESSVMATLVYIVGSYV